MLVLEGSLNEVPQIEWLNQQKSIVSVLEARSSRSKCRQAWFLLRAGREDLLLASPSPQVC